MSKKFRPEIEDDVQQDELLKSQVSQGLEKAKLFAKQLNYDEVKSGYWFVRLLRKVVETYDRNAKAVYFQQKYPGLPPDEIADILTSVTVRYATIAGAVAGAVITANQVATLSTAGMTAALFVSSIGAEMIYLARIQMQLVLDLSVVYDLQLDPEDPEDILMIFGYALGVTPTELVGKGLQVAAGSGARGMVKKYISKGTLKAVQSFARKLGFKILQRTIIKYAVPVASAAVGSSYNYMTTKSLGRIAKAHFKNRGRSTEELRALVSRQNTYDLAFPAAVLYLAQVDGEFSPKEKELYRAMLSRMSFDSHSQAEFQRLIATEENILEAMGQIEDKEVRRSLIEVLALMAAYDGELAEREREFLANAAERLKVPLDMDEVEQSTLGYRVSIKRNLVEKTAGVAGRAVTDAVGVAGRAAGVTKVVVVQAGSKAKGVIGKVWRRKKAATEKICPSCGASIPADFAFCPHCGASQTSTTERS